MCSWLCLFFVFFLNDTATTEIYTDGHTLSLHDALPISDAFGAEIGDHDPLAERVGEIDFRAVAVHRGTVGDREPCGTSGCDAAAVEKIKTPARRAFRVVHRTEPDRSEEHTSELPSLMRNSYAVFCLKKKKNNNPHNT